MHLAPTTSARVAAFDLDGTVIKSSYIEVGWNKRGGGGGKQQRRVVKRQTNGLEWEWWRTVVPQKLKEAHDSGCVIIPWFLFSAEISFIKIPIPHSLPFFSPLRCHCRASKCRESTKYKYPLKQVLGCVDVEPIPQVLGPSRMEEKDTANCCCRAYRSRPQALSSKVMYV